MAISTQIEAVDQTSILRNCHCLYDITSKLELQDGTKVNAAISLKDHSIFSPPKEYSRVTSVSRLRPTNHYDHILSVPRGSLIGGTYSLHKIQFTILQFCFIPSKCSL